ncbi:MAG: hypothetical protein A2Y86_05275 [Candidatus Aminicenantes bacterium RBG_13_62_12]|nr:MAG: hypothetical protein A2Y86_05275 [Candidatus Aminicenantes bacterium RBG_13_62_12]
MSLKKTICELWGKNWGWCSYYWDTIRACKETGLLGNPDCPLVEERRVHKDDVPTSTCALHKPPTPPLPKWRLCSATGREATRWCPATEVVYAEPMLACRTHKPPDPKKEADFILFSYDIWRPDYAESELKESLTRVGAAGCNYIRTFLGWPGKGDVRLQPFLPAGAAPAPFNLYKINPEWTRLLQRFQRMAAKCGMGLMVDFFGLQVAKMPSVLYAWFIAENNVNGIAGYTDTRPHAMTYWKWCLKEVMSLVGTEGNLVHLGNEQKAPGDGGYGNVKVQQVRDWCRAWAVPLANYLKNEVKVEMPISCTGEEYEGTGKGIVNELEAKGWEWRWLCNHLHGLSLWGDFEQIYIPRPDHQGVGWSQAKYYCLSDDGGGHNIPVEKRGIQHPSNPARWSANAKWRIDTVKRIMGRIRHIRFLEWMPMSMKSDVCKPGDLDQSVDVDVYWKCAEALWGIDIRRVL